MAAVAVPPSSAPASDVGHQFGSILLGQRGGTGQGSLRITSHGFLWRRSGGGKPVDIKAADIESLHWTRVTRGCQLGVRVKDGITTNFIGFRDKDLEPIRSYCKSQYGKDVEELPLATSGRNWGNVKLNGRSLSFMVDGRMAFEVPLPDVAQATQQKDDLVLEFHVDDAAGDEREDALMELTLHVPPTCPDWAPREEGNEEPPAKMMLDTLVGYTDTGAGLQDAPVASFSDVHVLAPRGRFEVAMTLSTLQLMGQAQDFKIRYTSIQRIFILPKSASPHTLVVVTLDPPIRKGQTYYTHILCQFPTDEDATIDLDITPDALAAKNEKCGGKLEAHMAGPLFEVFARALRGLSAAKITRPGTFKNSTGDGHAVRCSYKADDGYLYPLERAFFYIHKPPMLIPFDEVDSVELTRLDGNSVSSKTFDIVLRTRNNVEHQFRGIQRREWQGLLEFFQAKRLKVERLKTSTAPGQRGFYDEEGLRAALGEEEDEEDDEDFKAGDETDASGGGSDGSEGSDGDSDGSDVEVVEEEGISARDVLSKGSKKAKEPKEPKEPKHKEKREREEDVPPGSEEKPKKKKKEKEPKEEKEKEEAGGKKKRAKKDPNAPKNPTSAFMYFSTAMREQLKADNPGLTFGELSKAMGEKWKAATPEEKAPFEEKARADKARYQTEMAAYKAGGSTAATAAAGDAGEGDDAEEV